MSRFLAIPDGNGKVYHVSAPHICAVIAYPADGYTDTRSHVRWGSNDDDGVLTPFTAANVLASITALEAQATADAAERNPFMQPINCYGESIGEAIQGQLVRGQRGISQYEGR